MWAVNEIRLYADGPGAAATLRAEQAGDIRGVTRGDATMGFLGSVDRFGFREIRFGAGADRTAVRVAAASRGMAGVLQVRLGSPKGRIVGVLPVRCTGGADTWREQSAKLPHPVTGSREAHAVAAGGERTAAVGRLTFRKRAHGWGPGRRPMPRPPTARKRAHGAETTLGPPAGAHEGVTPITWQTMRNSGMGGVYGVRLSGWWISRGRTAGTYAPRA